MKHEQQLLITLYAPTTIVSFYTINKEEHPGNIVSYLSNRFNEILKANPWLTGRLVKQKIDGETDVYLSFEESIINTDDYFTVINDEKVFTLRDWIPVTEYLSTFKPSKVGYDCIDKDERLVQLTVIHNHDQTNLAVMFSLAHMIGDGATCYRIWKMLDKDQLVESLVVERHHDILADLQ